MTRRTWILAAVLVLAAGGARADVTPHALFSDGMVLQRDLPMAVWGTAAPGEAVTVTMRGEKAGLETKPIVADDKGRWVFRAETPLPAGGPYTLTIKGTNTVTIKNVLVGEVWVCSGQSNMEWPMTLTTNNTRDIAAATNPNLRLFTVPKRASQSPQANVDAKWVECNPQTVASFSAVGYFFGHDLQKALGVPVGLINTSWGGTVAEAWTGHEALEAEPSLKYLTGSYKNALTNYDRAADQYVKTLENVLADAKKARADGKPLPPIPPPPAHPAGNPNFASVLSNGMIEPLVPFGVRGAIWYQGESNVMRAYEYRTLMPTLIEDWRKRFGRPDMPFFMVQLAPYMRIVQEPAESNWAELREAQHLTAKKLKNVGVAVITDAGDEFDIHPRQKESAGARLALLARAIAYGEKIVYSGPVYREMKVEGSRAVLSFDHVGGGLMAQGGELTGFTVAGKDGKFHNAKATIEGNKVVVSCPEVPEPAAVRFGWANYPVVNLFNEEGLPATPFRTDDLPVTTQPKK